jgi:hypothetical protein
MNVWFRFAISALAVWRLTHLLAAEDGPWDLMLRVRVMLGTNIWGKLIDCFNCLSIWVSIPFAFYVTSGILNILIVWFALSGIASLANRVGQEPIVFQPLEHQEK